MTKKVVWIHGDALSPTNPALAANPDAPALFVWDEELINRYNLSLKRMVFMYECLLEMNVEIRRGNVAVELARFAKEHGANEIITTETVAPRFHQIASALSRANFRITVHRVTPFIDTDTHFDLKRFSRYWRKAQRLASQPSA